MIPDKFKGLLGILKSKLDMGLSESTGMQRITSEEVKWSKGPSLSILPYGLELAGVTPSPMLSAEPKNKKIALSSIVLSSMAFISLIYMV